MKKLFLILCGLSFGLTAATIDTNHSAALVNTTELTDWQQSQQALTALLSKKSGLSIADISANYVIDERFKPAMLRSYYEQVPSLNGTNKQWFNLVVDEDQIQQLMLSQRIPIWPDRRGTVYVWVVEEFEDLPLIHSNKDSEAIYWLKKWFDVMGVPTQFYDPAAEDLLTFKPQDVRFMRPDLIDYLQAEKDVSMTLLVFIKHTRNGYSYRFGLSEPEKQTVIKNLQFLDFATGMKSLVGFVQNFMADDQRLFADEFSENTVAITINDINEANNLLKLLNYLDQHALINAYQVNQLKSKQLDIMMQIKVLPETFIKYVESEGYLLHQPLGLGNTLFFKSVL